MAKKGKLENNEKRKRLVKIHLAKRLELRKKSVDMNLTPEERFEARQALQKLPQNSHPNRIRNRCALSGRPRAYYRKFGLSRIAFRDMANAGLLPGVTKSSW